MAWWEKLFEPMPTGNLVGDTIGAINGSPVAAARTPSGSFDPNKVVAAMPEAYREGFAPAAEFLAAVSNQRQQAAEQAMKMPESTWLQGIGRALSAASVPVAYAQGNLGYGGKMAGNTEQDIYNRRRDLYEDQATKSRVAGTDAFYGSLGTAGLDYISKRRNTERAFKLQAQKIMSAARRTGDPRIIAEAEAMVRGLAEAQGVGGGAAAPAASAVTPSSATGGAAATSVPGTVMTPLSAAPAAGAAPGPQQSTMEIGTPSVMPSPAAGSPDALARFKRNQAAVALAAGDEDAAKALIEEAKLLEEPGQKGRIKLAEEGAVNAAAVAEQTRAANQSAPAIVASLDRLMAIGNDKQFPESAVGTFDSAKLPFSDRTIGDVRMAVTPFVDEAKHVETRNAIQNELKFLALRMKDFVRKPGEGPWTDYDQQNLEELASGRAEASYDQKGFQKVMQDLRERIQTTIMDPAGVKLPPARTSVEARSGSDGDTPTRVIRDTDIDPTISYKQAVNPQTGERLIKVGDEWLPYEKTDALEIPLSREMELKNRKLQGKRY